MKRRANARCGENGNCRLDSSWELVTSCVGIWLRVYEAVLRVLEASHRRSHHVIRNTISYWEGYKTWVLLMLERLAMRGGPAACKCRTISTFSCHPRPLKVLCACRITNKFVPIRGSNDACNRSAFLQKYFQHLGPFAAPGSWTMSPQHHGLPRALADGFSETQSGLDRPRNMT